MNIAEQVGFDGVMDMDIPAELQPIFKALVSRLHASTRDIIFQMRKEPSVFYANPDTEPEKISGFKDGDLAVWVDGAGVSQFRVLVN